MALALVVGLGCAYLLVPRWNAAELEWAAQRVRHRLLGPTRPAPWEAQGLSMVQRLALVAEHEETPPGWSPVVKYQAIRSIPLFAGVQKFRFYHARGLMVAGELPEAIDLLEGLAGEAEPGSRQWSRSMLHLAVAHLRYGEVENCLEGHNADSCYLPIREGGVHEKKQGSQSAVEVLERVLEHDPDNVKAAWLLNIAAMTLGEYPRGVPAEFRLLPELLAPDRPALGLFADRAGALGVDDLTTSGGAIVEDMTGDGLLDIVSSGQGLREQLRLFVNRGDGGFDDATERLGLSGQFGGLNISDADYDGDGDVDLLVLRGGWRDELGRHPNSLLRNDGDRGFVDVTEEAGLLSFDPTQVGVWADYDRDGAIDLFVGNESRRRVPRPSRLYRNNGDGTFTDVAAQVGLDEPGLVKGAAWGDIDNDGLPDLFVSRFRASNSLFKNLGETDSGWSFVDVATELGVVDPSASFVPWFWDFNNDGWEDLLVATEETRLEEVAAHYFGAAAPAESWPRMYLNDGKGGFVDATAETGLDLSMMVMGANFGDIDNDGYLDAYFGTGAPPFSHLVPNRMFRSVEGTRLEEVTTAGGFGHLQKGHGIAFGDLDNDGDQDIYAQMGGYYPSDTYHNALFENPGHGNHWVTLRLKGVESNRMAVGARLQLTAVTAEGTRRIHRTVGTGGSFGASSLQVEVGLGQATGVSDLEIRWPSGRVQLLPDLPIDRILEIEEGSAPKEVSLPPIELLSGDRPHGH